MMDSIHIPTIQPMSFANEPQFKRARKRLLFIAGICLGICVAYAIVVISTCTNKYQAEDSPPGTKIGPAFISVLFYSFGLFVTYRYYEIGLRVFAWLGVILLIITGVAIITLNIDFLPNFPPAKSADLHDDIYINGLMFFSISAILCIVVFILTVIIVTLTFKLARLLDGNQHSTIQQI